MAWRIPSRRRGWHWPRNSALAGRSKTSSCQVGQSKFSNRVAWAKSYLQQAGLITSPRRGHFQITGRSREILESHPSRIDIKFLERYPEFAEFRDPKVVLTDAHRLAELMIDFEVCVSSVRTYQVKRIDSDYFEEA